MREGRLGPEVSGNAAERLALAGTLREIERMILRDLKPVRCLPSDRVILYAAAFPLSCVVAAGPVLLGDRGWEAMDAWQRGAVFALLAAFGLLLLWSLVRQMTPGNKQAPGARKLPAGIPPALMLAMAILFRFRPETGFLASGWACLRTGLTYASPAALICALFPVRGAILYPGLCGATAGALAGLAGLTVLELTCPNENALHLAIWHCAVVMVVCAAGATFAMLTDRVRALAISYRARGKRSAS
jgi:hypothetical protein